MANDELLKAGIAAAKVGDTARASNLLVQVVQTDPNSELGWLWLGLCRTVPEQREYCFRRALAINPQNAEARRQMDLLQKPAPPTPEIRPLKPSETPAHVPLTPSIGSPLEKLPVSQPVNASQPARKVVSPKSRKKNNEMVIWAGAGLVLCACIAVAGVFVLSQLIRPTSALIPTAIPSLTAAPITATPNYVPVFESAPCSFKKPDHGRVDCGFVIVPEDRSGDPSDRIKLAVAVYHSTSSAPKPDPIVYLQGGPGGEALEWGTFAYEYAIAPLLRERDFIIFDPRGVGRSVPALKCDEFGKTYLQDLEGKIPGDKKAFYYEGALLSCKNNLTQQGAKLSAYTSVDMAADVKDVILALGYRQANLYGISYGTRVAQVVMRNHPEVVRSAILDSVVPVESQMFDPSASGNDAALRVLFDDCKSDPACSAAFPELEATYSQTFNQFNAQPEYVKVKMIDDSQMDQKIDGSTFQNAIMWALRMPQTIPLAPRLIYLVRNGDKSMLSLILSFPVFAFDSISLGDYISVNCHDQFFSMAMENLDTTIFDMCKLWDSKPLAPGENDPVTSAIPTLIFAGRYDATTPPALAHQLAGHLSHSTVVEIPNQGHGPSGTGFSDCPTKIIVSFLQDPNPAPDSTCVREIPAIKFIIPYNASVSIPFESVTLEQDRVSTVVPSGWTKSNYGFFIRDAYYGDITQIGIQRAAVSEADWLMSLSTNFEGKEGFDQPPVKHDERKAGGLTWSIYQTSTQGFPIEIALASSRNQTFLVLMLSYKDEHDALYNQVLLPILDATKASR